MFETLNQPIATPTVHVVPEDGVTDDLSSLAWVHGELRRSLESAHKSLRRYLKESAAVAGSDVDAVDPAVLRNARAQLHQGVGALELVGLPAVANVLRASESAVQRMAARPALINAASVGTIEQASFALLDFLARQLAGKPVSPLLLFPQYRAALQLAAAERVHPADLWQCDWHWRELPADTGATARAADEGARTEMESGVLSLMRDPRATAFASMSQLCADLGAGFRTPRLGSLDLPFATLWQLAAAVFEALGSGLLKPDAYTLRIPSRLLAQLRLHVAGHPGGSDRLAQDLLFFCSHAAEVDARSAPRLAAVRRAWRLQEAGTADYETQRLGRFDPAQLALARKRVGAAKDSWSAVAGAELHRLHGLADAFSLVGDSLGRLLPGGTTLSQSMQGAVAQAVAAAAEPPPALAMEVATAMLFVDASLEDGELDHPELADRVAHLAARIDAVRGGAAAQPLEPWMEELYHRVSDKQTMGSVVQELRSSLSEVEKQIDGYFRNPAEQHLLLPVPAQLSSMRGVLSVLGLDHASQAVLRMRSDVDALALADADPHAALQSGLFDRLADNLGALSFLIDMISVQPQLAKSLFTFDPQTGQLSAVMGQSDRVSAFADLDDAATAASASAASSSAAQPRSSTPDAATAPDAQHDVETAPAMPAVGSGLEDDVEMREVFIEEAREVVADAHAALRRLADVPTDSGEMTALRRAFHTLKGSARMVGLGAFGDAAWACEQIYNARLAQSPQLDEPLRIYTGGALAYLGDWVEAIGSGQDGGHRTEAVTDAADALQAGRDAVAIALPEAAAPAAFDFELQLELDDEAAPEAEPEATLSSASAETPARPVLPELTELLDLPDLPRGAEIVEFEFQLDAAAAGAGGTAEADDSAAEADPTRQSDRVLDLPGRGAPDMPARAESDTDFDLDLPPLDLPPLDLPPLDRPAPTGAATAMPEAETLELDASAFGGLFKPTTADELDASAAEVVEPDAEAEPASRIEPDAVALPEPLVTEVPVTLDEPGSETDAEPEAEPEPGVDIEPSMADVDADAVAGAPDTAEPLDDEQVRVIGPLRIGIPLFNIYLNEADELSRRLCTELAEWAIEHEDAPVPESSVARAHSLAGSSATVGYAELSALARALEHALMRSQAAGRGRDGEPALFIDTADEIRRLLHQFAAGFLRSVPPELLDRLSEHERLPQEPSTESDAGHDAAEADALEAFEREREREREREADTVDVIESIDAVHPDADDDADVVDPELFPIFEEEAEELLPQLQSRLRDWHHRPTEPGAAMACMRTLHTLKGGARLAGALRLGDMAHRLESEIESLAEHDVLRAADIEPLQALADTMSHAFDALRARPAPAVPVATAAAVAPEPAASAPDREQAPAEPGMRSEVEAGAGQSTEHATEPATEAEAEAEAESAASPAAAVQAPQPVAIDWQRFATDAEGEGEAGSDAAGADRESPAAPAAGAGAVVRVRAGLLDRMVNQAGEVSITRARVDNSVRQMQGSLGELTESLERLRRQLRDIEVQAETQISSRLEAAKALSVAFDPLEMDRFTRFQELTRFMAESVNDVATLQRSLQRMVQSAEDELAAQARLTRELQDDLLRTRMVEFDSIAERLHRTVRQAAKDAGKSAQLAIVGSAIEVDRGVLERMQGSFEHLLRNAVAHGVERADARTAAGKPAVGSITVTVAQSGNEVAIDFADDGAGLDPDRIRARAVERGLLDAGATLSEDEALQYIYRPGFSTAASVTELAGRGVGLDVVRSEVIAMGGRIETHSRPGQGTRLRLLLPLTTAVTQIVMLRCGNLQVAVPAPLVENVLRVPSAEVEQAYAGHSLEAAGELLPFFWLAGLLRAEARGAAAAGDDAGAAVPTASTFGDDQGDVQGRSQTVVVIRSAAQRVALHVDEVLGNQEVVVKNVGPQLSRMPGLAGVTLLPSGVVALIYNPVALAAVYADALRERQRHDAVPAAGKPQVPVAVAVARAPLVMVVDDSLTVRRITQRLLVREGYRVVTAKDGLEALTCLADERPAVLLSDIEMPRMDGFDLLRNVRADSTLAGLPVVMITSRTAQKHRDYAFQLGADHYLGKPFAEEELLQLVAQHARTAMAA